VATTIWHQIPDDDPLLVDAPRPKDCSTATGVRDMHTVRRLVTEILGGRDGDRSQALTDDEWEHLCRTVGDSETDRQAISRILLEAYALRDRRVARQQEAQPGTHREERPPCWVPVPDDCTIAEESGDGGVLTNELIPSDFAAPSRTHDLPTGNEPAVATAPHAAFVPAAGGDLIATEEVVVIPDRLPSNVGVGTRSVAPPSRRRSSLATTASPARTRRRGVHSRSRLRAMEERKRQTWLTVASWVRNIGAIILLFVAWQLWGTAIQQHHTQATLQSQFEAKVHHASVKPPPGFSLIPATHAIPDPPQGTVMAELQIPKISLQQFVVSGTNEGDLDKGPGHYLGTALPGQAGNVAIAGHRTTHGAPFNRLAELSIGDPIYLTAANGERLTYIVSAAPVAVSPRDVTVLNNFGDDRLTLTTCNPEYSAVQRLIVVAAFLPPGTPHPVQLAKGNGKAYSLTPSVTSGWNTSLLPWVLLELAALVALGLFFRRLSGIYGRSGRWLVLGPVWLAVLLALFQTLTSFLPAAV
jgi:sortase A